jgi:hypothetical protein
MILSACLCGNPSGIKGPMSFRRLILGGMIAGCLAGMVAASPPDQVLRPVARDAGAVPVAEPAVTAVIQPIGLADQFISTSNLVPLLPTGDLRPQLRPVGLGLRPLVQTGALIRPLAREDRLPEARWDGRAGTESWTRAAWDGLRDASRDITDVIPRDIATWCPGYVQNDSYERRAFWVGLMSALARHESTYNPRAVGGGGQWYGLLQIYPPTADHFGCDAQSGSELQDPEANLACAARIMSVTVARDNAVALHDGRWQGVAADWGPFTSEAKREDMAAWTREQDYCQLDLAVRVAPRPPARPGEGLLPPVNAGIRPLIRPDGLVPPTLGPAWAAEARGVLLALN